MTLKANRSRVAAADSYDAAKASRKAAEEEVAASTHLPTPVRTIAVKRAKRAAVNELEKREKYAHSLLGWG